MIKTLLDLDESREKFDGLDYELRKRVSLEIEALFSVIQKNIQNIVNNDEYNQLYKQIVVKKLENSLTSSLDFAEGEMKFVRYKKNDKIEHCAIEYVDKIYNGCISKTAELYKDEYMANKTNYFISAIYHDTSKNVFSEREKNHSSKNRRYIIDIENNKEM